MNLCGLAQQPAASDLETKLFLLISAILEVPRRSSSVAIMTSLRVSGALIRSLVCKWASVDGRLQPPHEGTDGFSLSPPFMQSGGP